MSGTIDFGIDLGTTNSSIALCRGGSIRVFQSVDLMQVTPSVVYLSKSGRMLAGKKAYDTWVADPQNTQAEFKRWMGFSDKLKFPASGRELTAEELSAEVLKALRADAMRATNEEITAAVITVPAAFGSLQCEATARAAAMAGIEQAPLLQEPIAAALAYGAGPESRGQAWMAFDLGGGTLDIAIVSTRNDQLTVLEHQGDNRLGGKDIDQALADLLFGPLRQTFNLPREESEPDQYARLRRAVIRQAEMGKIALSTATETTIELFDIGDDLDGKPIELSLSITRAQLESKIKPLVQRCLKLVERALEGARMSARQIDRILLIGGPTQMPMVRQALGAFVGAKLEYSLDPMTVVAQGASVYASTITKKSTKPAVSSESASPSPSAVQFKLSYERASGSLESPVAGVFEESSPVTEIHIQSKGGLWRSGWIKLRNGKFSAQVYLTDRQPSTDFQIHARDSTGKQVPISPKTFSVSHMLPIGAPPLPHTLAVELSDFHGERRYDPIFPRNTPLPAETRRNYTADRTLRPSDVLATLPIKLWEIEVSEDPHERWWAGCMHLRADQITRPIPEGSELELTLKVDESRKVTIDVFVPVLNQSFSQGVYVPDPPTARSQLRDQLDLCFHRLYLVRQSAYECDRDDLIPKLRQIEDQLEAIAERLATEEASGSSLDPDATLAPTNALRKIQMILTQIEEQLDSAGETDLAREVRADLVWTQSEVIAHGTPAEAAELERVVEKFRKYLEARDPRGLKWVKQRLKEIRVPVLNRTPEFWDRILNFLRQPSQRFANSGEAARLIRQAEEAQRRGDFSTMRDACNQAYGLLPKDRIQAAKDQASDSGLRGG